jgi:YegS/Rv2252/BmrU family lipid kinase
LTCLRVIVNPNAGGGRAQRLLPLVESALRARSAEHRIDRTRSLEHAAELARDAAQAGALAVAMGGDGLVGTVAGALRGTPTALLGVIPAGRGNDLARKLAIPADPAGACATLLDGRPRTIDLAEVNGRIYLGIASAGIDSDIQVIANANRLPLGKHVYAYATLRALATWKPARFEVAVDGQELRFSGYSVAVANSGVFGGGMYLSPDSQIDDGVLEVVAFEAIPKRRYVANLPRVFKGTHLQEPGAHVLSGKTVSIGADRPFQVFADGEPMVDLPATVQVLPRAIRVMVPAEDKPEPHAIRAIAPAEDSA